MDINLQGKVIKAFSGYYYVNDNNRIITCKLRGRLKQQRFSLFVGDEVVYQKTGDMEGIIEEVLPRRSLLMRPMVANVEQVVLTFAAANPAINTKLIDKFLLLAELSNLEVILCINKIDLADSQLLESIVDLYRNIGYCVVLLSAKTGTGILELKNLLHDKSTVFSGPSGVGKSTTLNAIEPGLSLSTGEVSKKIGRGRHTTRFAQLLALSGGGYVVDTPGFSLAEFQDVSKNEIAYCFREFRSFAPNCKFSTCIHFKEPQCAVKNAVEEGMIAKQRYESYLDMLKEVDENKRGY